MRVKEVHNIRQENLTSSQIINIMNADRALYIGENEDGDRCILKNIPKRKRKRSEK